MDVPLSQSGRKPQLMLTSPDDVPLWREHPDRFAGAVAPDGAACDEWERTLDPLPVGIALDCPPVPDEEDEDTERPVTLYYIGLCKDAFRDRLHEDAAFYYLRGSETFAALRAAVLALGDICGRTVIAELTLEDDEGHLADGTDVRAAIGVLQRIGVTTVILRARSMEELSEALERTAPYARLSLGVCVPHGSTKTCRFITRRSLFRRRETAFRRSCAHSTRRRTAAASCATTTILFSRPTAPTRTSSIRRSTFPTRSNAARVWARICSRQRMTPARSSSCSRPRMTLWRSRNAGI